MIVRNLLRINPVIYFWIGNLFFLYSLFCFIIKSLNIYLFYIALFLGSLFYLMGFGTILKNSEIIKLKKIFYIFHGKTHLCFIGSFYLFIFFDILADYFDSNLPSISGFIISTTIFVRGWDYNRKEIRVINILKKKKKL